MRRRVREGGEGEQLLRAEQIILRGDCGCGGRRESEGGGQRRAQQRNFVVNAADENRYLIVLLNTAPLTIVICAVFCFIDRKRV